MTEESSHPNTTDLVSTESNTKRRRLYRSVVDRKIAGVCGGIAEYFGIDALLVRVLCLCSILFGLIGAFAYLIAWFVIPEDPEGALATPREPSKSGRYVVGAALILFGFLFLADENDWDWMVPWHWHYYLPGWFSWSMVFAIILILFGFFMIFRDREDDTGKEQEIESAGRTSFDSPTEQGGQKMKSKRLHRSFNERIIGGVCGGLAEYFEIDPSLVRIAWVLLTFLSGIFPGVVAYVVIMVIVPERLPDAKDTPTTTSTNS